MSETVIDKIFSVPTPARLSLGNIRGSVEISAGEAGAIAIRAEKQPGSGDAERTEIIIEQNSDGSVRVETRYDEGWLGWLAGGKPCRVAYSVRVPAACALRVNCVSADAAVSGLRESFEASTVSGDVTVNDVTGPLRLRSVSGKISGKQLNGALSLEIVSGNVYLTASCFESVSANSVSGDIHLHTALGAGSYRFGSVSGNVRLTLPEAAPMNAHLKTLSGRLRTEIPVFLSQQSDGSQQAVAGSGGAEIVAKSVSGDMWIGLEDSARQPAQAAPQQTNRVEVLERVERGEISVEQAITLLR